MAVLGRWSGGATTLIPGTTFAAPNALFPTQDRNDGSAYTFTSSTSVLTLPSTDLANGYLMIARVHYGDTSNGRFSFAGRFQQTGGTGDFVNLQTGGYSRNTSDNETYLCAMGFVNNPSASATFAFQWERESDAPTGGTVKSSLDVIPMFYSNHGIYNGSNLSLMGGTTRNVVPIGSTIAESDTGAIERVTNVVTVKGDNKRYMVMSSQWYQNRGEPGTTRTQRIFGHDYDGSADLAAQSYAYYRQATADGTGGCIHDLIETVTADRTIEMTCFRGLGISNGQGGADVDGQAPTQGVQALVVLELNDEAEVFRRHDATGLQAFDAASPPHDLNALRTNDFTDSASWVVVGTVGMENNTGAAIDALTGANVWAASTDVTSGTRGTYEGRITVDGTEDGDIFHGNYIRGNQGGEDTFGLAFNPVGFVALADNGDLGVSVSQTGSLHAVDTQADTVGMWGINLDTMEPAGVAELSAQGMVVIH